MSVVVGADGLARTPWATSDPLLLDYYDNEWGMPVEDERGLFERVCLEAFQAGLSWLTILRKRDGFRVAFSDFDVDTCASITDDRIEQLMVDSGIVRNRKKIESVRTNARATVALREAEGLVDLIWSFQPSTTPAPRTMNEVPTVSEESKALSVALRKRKFVFVGPTTMYALMEAIGMVDTHLVGSYRRGCSQVWTTDS